MNCECGNILAVFLLEANVFGFNFEKYSLF